MKQILGLISAVVVVVGFYVWLGQEPTDDVSGHAATVNEERAQAYAQRLQQRAEALQGQSLVADDNGRTGNIGALLDPNDLTPVPEGREVINIGEPLDPDTYVSVSASAEVVNIGEIIADPELYRSPTRGPIINIGEPIADPLEWLSRQAARGQARDIGQPLDPEIE